MDLWIFGWMYSYAVLAAALFNIPSLWACHTRTYRPITWPGADTGICVRGGISLPLPPPLHLSFPFPPSFPLPSPYLPSNRIPFPSLPFPPLRSMPPVLRLRGMGERSSSPSGSGRSPAAKRFLVNCSQKIAPVVEMLTKDTSTLSIAKT